MTTYDTSTSPLDYVRDADQFDTRELIEALDDLDADDPAEAEAIVAIRAFLEEVSDYSGDRPEDGVQLIADWYFETYARELADDLGLLNTAAAWPLTCIDWEQAARELRMDYSSIEIAGHTYWVR